MGVLAYVNHGQESPYKHFFDPVRWIEISELFNKAATRVLGFSTECPLSTCIDVGTKALPTLDDFQKSMAQINSQLTVSSENEMQVSDCSEKQSQHFNYLHYFSLFCLFRLRLTLADGYIIRFLTALSSGNRVLFLIHQ